MSLVELEKDLYGNDWDAAKIAAVNLAKNGSIEAKNILLGAIKSSSVDVRNAAALAVSEEKIQDAIPFLVESILSKENINHRGTLVYALQELDCKELFEFLFKLAVEANYECRAIACDILWDQGFLVTDKELDDAENYLLQWAATQEYREDDEMLFAHLREVIAEMRNG